ncbi:ubiquitin-conjugating enzyme E2Q-like protein 1 [Contarinia nasturtii]|uniref:ubiquitin-conjugating enzyme E2Q-like protein 1 n=1 Tax=Contarinia nasturtii TaxID=265458 RepID=UPI0012D45FC0|nr:ubiquitin-conjugating enzyme E2Q-like protein 1 [Contarinia nasturtii]
MSFRPKERVLSALRKLFHKTSANRREANNGAASSSNTSKSPARKSRRGISPSPSQKYPTKANDKTIRAKRLMKELKEIQRASRLQKNSFSVELVNDNLFEWYVRVYDIDQESELKYDMEEQNISHILLHLIFPDNFPFLPPFMRVVEPKIEKGFVMNGGAICMELLTPRGWASAYTVEAVIMQFTASLSKGRARIARTKKSGKDFSKQSAEEAFRSLVKTHEKYGWVTPAQSEG